MNANHKNMSPLTKAQLKVLIAIQDHMTQCGYPPTTRELAKLLSLSTPSIHEQLQRLESKGYIRKQKNKARSIEILKSMNAINDSKPVTIAIPILGNIAAGQPIMAEEHQLDHILIDKRMLGSGTFFALHVNGNSMSDIGIKNNDLVIIRQQPVAENGDIIAALLGSEATVKRLRILPDQILLVPENKRYKPFDVTLADDFRIIGKVVTWLSKQ